MSPWLVLTFAGLLEVCWTIGLKYSEGFTRPLISVATVLAMIASMWLLGVAVRDLPIGSAYAVWVGIGVVGATFLGVFLFKEPVTLLRFAFVAMLIVSIAGLKMTTPPEEPTIE